MKIFGDASSIILLAKVTLLSIFYNNAELSMTETSYRETTQKEEREDAKMIINQREADGIEIVEDPEDTEKFSKQYNLGKGEASVVVSAGEKAGIVLTDDKRGLKAARANQIDRATAITVLVSMAEKGKVGGEKALDSLKILEREGRYDPYIIDDARERIEEVGK